MTANDRVREAFDSGKRHSAGNGHGADKIEEETMQEKANGAGAHKYPPGDRGNSEPPPSRNDTGPQADASRASGDTGSRQSDEHAQSCGKGTGINHADASRWVGVDPPELRFTIEHLVPEGMTTLLVAQGGAGKSLLMQIAMACIATGLPFLGKATTRGNAAGIFAEDPEEVLHIRQVRINRQLGVGMELLSGRCFIKSYAGVDATLWRDRAPTAFAVELESQLADIPELRFVIIDNVALVFDGDENDRIETTRFLNYLNGMAARLGVGLILSTHQSKSTDGTMLRLASGTTAWVNASRSVLELKPASGEEPPALRIAKANHTAPGQEIKLRWHEGVLLAEPPLGSFESNTRARELDRLIFEKVQAAWDADLPLSDTPSVGDRYLPRAIARSGQFRAEEARKAMLQFIENGYLVAGQRTSRTKRGLRIKALPPGLAGAAGLSVSH